MKDLKRYLTKIKSTNLKEYFDKIDGNENQIDFLAFLIYHSFFIEKDFSVKLSKSYSNGDIYFNQSLMEYHNIHVDDELNGNTDAEKGEISCWYRSLILGAMLPKFNVYEFCEYIDDLDDEEAGEGLTNVIDASKVFMKKHKITKEGQKWVLDNFRRGASDQSEYNIIVIKSNYLVRIYRNERLRELLEHALQCNFIRENMIMQSTVVYTECCYYDDGDFLSITDIISFVKEYEKIFGIKKRHFKQNFGYANKLLFIDPNDIFSIEYIINAVMNTLDTKEMVMF